VAQKLHDDYKFSYDTLKVLLGGWNTWKQENAKDPNKYPIEPAGAGAQPSTGEGVVTATVQLQPEVATPKP